MLEGDKIFLRPLEEADLAMVAEWRNKPSIWKHFFTRYPIALSQQRNFYTQLISDQRKYIFIICKKGDSEAIGTIGLDKIDPFNQSAEIGNVLIGNDRCLAKGFAKEALLLLVSFCFSHLNMRRIYLCAFEDNVRALKLYESCGFQREGVLKEAHFSCGSFKDVIIMGLLRGSGGSVSPEASSGAASGERYWQNWDEADAAERIDEYWLREEEGWRDLLASDMKLHFKPGAQILEVGSGTGLIYRKLREKGIVTPESYRGGDVSAKMREIAMQRFPEATFEALDIFRLPFADASQPNVVCIHVIQHLPHYADALRELMRVAGGRLYVVSWFNWTLEDEIALSPPSPKWGNRRFHNNNYSLPGFVKFIADNSRHAISDMHIHCLEHPNYSICIDFKGR